MEDVRVGEVDEAVTVGMCGGDEKRPNFLAIHMEGHGVVESEERAGPFRGCGRDSPTPSGSPEPFQHPQPNVVVGDERRSHVGQSFIPPLVVDVDVGIDDEPNLLIGDLSNPLDDALGQSWDLVVHEENSLGARQNADVAPSGRGLEHVDLSLNRDDDHFHTLDSLGRGGRGVGHNGEQEKGKKDEERSWSVGRCLHGRSERGRGRKGIRVRSLGDLRQPDRCEKAKSASVTESPYDAMLQ